ncbi:hypothetical protein ACIBG8_03125 [Nonomuraea sp. NPDC050556]|uniref:hypothetical protein n=1 Tax=Nonomuraea sp. NPDC050556 TaxID=3364369 RepID=UPI00378BB60D
MSRIGGLLAGVVAAVVLAPSAAHASADVVVIAEFGPFVWQDPEAGVNRRIVGRNIVERQWVRPGRHNPTGGWRKKYFVVGYVENTNTTSNADEFNRPCTEVSGGIYAGATGKSYKVTVCKDPSSPQDQSWTWGSFKLEVPPHPTLSRVTMRMCETTDPSLPPAPHPGSLGQATGCAGKEWTYEAPQGR